MVFPSRPELDEQSFQALLAHARFELAPDRHDMVRDLLQTVAGVLDSLDAYPLGQTPPASAYDARWE